MLIFLYSASVLYCWHWVGPTVNCLL